MNQHYVPKVYLRNFAEQKGKEYYIDVYDHQIGKNFTTNIKNICVEKDFYTLDENSMAGKNKLTVEKVYADFLEPDYQEAYELITNDKVININPLERVKILSSIIQLYMRNPKILHEMIKANAILLNKSFKNAQIRKLDGFSFLNYDYKLEDWSYERISDSVKEKTITQFKEKHLSATVELAEKHSNAVIEVIKSDDPKTTFFTSDNPLISTNIIENNNSPLRRTSDFLITINPYYAVQIYHDKTKSHSQIYKQHGGNLNIALINEYIKKQSNRFHLGSVNSFNRHKELQRYLNDESVEAKINIMRQIVEHVLPTQETSKSLKLMAKYLNIYDQQGTLTKEQEHEFMLAEKELTKEWKINRVG